MQAAIREGTAYHEKSQAIKDSAEEKEEAPDNKFLGRAAEHMYAAVVEVLSQTDIGQEPTDQSKVDFVDKRAEL